ncbi:MAG: carbohydrate ABC transporter permease [Bacteroidota bacterium]
MSRFSRKTAGIIAKMEYRDPAAKLTYWLWFAILMAIAAICLLPPLWLFISSFKSIPEFYARTPTLLPKQFDFRKFFETWRVMRFEKYYLRSLEMASGDIAFSLVLNSMFGYALSQLRPKGAKFLTALLLWTVLLPNTLSIVPVYANIVNFPLLHFSLTDTFLPMWLMSGSNAFYVLIFKSYFDGIPAAYTEAAMLDGANKLQIFTRVIAPMSRPVYFVIAIFTLNSSWSNFFWPYLVLAKDELQTVMIRLYTMTPNSTATMGLSIDQQLMGIVYAILPPVVIFFFLQKYIMRGSLTLGGLKG